VNAEIDEHRGRLPKQPEMKPSGARADLLSACRGNPGDPASLRAGAVRILLTQDDGAKGFDRMKGEGLSFQVTVRQSVDAIAAEFERHGGTLDTEPTTAPWGARIIRFRDPDGFRFTISSSEGAA
jgi:uncharacterized glyoxalase superfamily protein PhnB